MSEPVAPTENPSIQAVAGPAGPAPARRRNSVRRTATVDMTWPGGYGTRLRLHGNARDAVTLDPHDPPVVVETASTNVGIGEHRTIEDIAAFPSPSGLESLVGCRGGGALRSALDEHLPGERSSGSPLYLLLDDISGCSLIAGFGWSRWTKDWLTPPDRVPRPNMEGVCIGFRTGSTALVEQASGPPSHRTRPVPSLVNASDSFGWHDLPPLPDVSMRRARRIDIWRDESGMIQIDAYFQDSSGDPGPSRVAVHEYVLRATADPETMTLVTVTPDARILPFMECPAAVDTAQLVVGTRLADLRRTVLERLAKTNGCTHLNDALRALAEVPVLVRHLDRIAEGVTPAG